MQNRSVTAVYTLLSEEKVTGKGTRRKMIRDFAGPYFVANTDAQNDMPLLCRYITEMPNGLQSFRLFIQQNHKPASNESDRIQGTE